MYQARLADLAVADAIMLMEHHLADLELQAKAILVDQIHMTETRLVAVVEQASLDLAHTISLAETVGQDHLTQFQDHLFNTLVAVVAVAITKEAATLNLPEAQAVVVMDKSKALITPTAQTIKAVVVVVLLPLITIMVRAEVAAQVL